MVLNSRRNSTDPLAKWSLRVTGLFTRVGGGSGGSRALVSVQDKDEFDLSEVVAGDCDGRSSSAGCLGRILSTNHLGVREGERGT